MKLFIASLLLTVVINVFASQSNLIQSGGSDGCSSEESSEEQDLIVEQCSAEVQTAIYSGFDKTLHHGLLPLNVDSLRKKREIEMTPTMRRASGCVLQCLFKKYEALGEGDLPTRHGLMTLANDGVTDRRYFMATSHIVDKCYSQVREFKQKIRLEPVLPGEYCDLAYEVFTCITEGLDDFCDQK